MPRDHGRTATKRRDHDHSDGPIQAARRGTRAGGEPLAPAVRTPLEARFGHDFSTVRIHSDAEAGSAATELRADAYTVGQDIVFGDGAFAPVTSEGERLLAHELTHVVQQSSSADLLRERQSIDAREGSARVSRRTDPAERAADAAAESVLAGEPVAADLLSSIASTESPSGGAAVVQRWPWDDDSTSSAPAPAPASDSGSSSGGGSIWDGVTSFASTAASDVKSAAGAVYDNYEKSTDFASLNKELGQGVDWVEKKSAASTQAMVDSTAGIPVLSQLAQGAAWVENASTDVTGGVVKGAGDLVTGIAGGLAHPIDAAAGVEGVVEHTGGGVPFLGSTLKGIHGLYDLGVNGGGQYGNSIGDLANHVFNPLQQQQDDTQFLGALGKGIVAPGDEKDGGGWQRWKDNPLEAAARAVTNIAPMVMGVGEAAAPEAAADVTTAAADADAASAIKPPAPPAPGAFDIEPPPSTKPYDSSFFNADGASARPPRSPLASSVAVPGPVPDVVPGAAVSPGPPVELPPADLAPHVPGDPVQPKTFSKNLGVGKTPADLGLPQNPDGSLNVEALKDQYKNPLAKNLGVGKTPADLGLPQNPDGSLNVDELLRRFGKGKK